MIDDVSLVLENLDLHQIAMKVCLIWYSFNQVEG